MQSVSCSPGEEWNVIVSFAAESDAVVADISAIVVHLKSADHACELQTGRAPSLAVATEVLVNHAWG